MPRSRPPIASSRCNGIRTAIPATRPPKRKFKEINEAYDVLKDGDKRAAYDRFGHAAFEKGNGASAHGFGSDFGSAFSDIFEGIFGDGRRPRPRRQRPRARRRSALQYGDHARGGLSRQDRRNPHPDLGHLRSLLRLRRQGRHQAADLLDLRRGRTSPACAGLLHAGAHLPGLPGPRPGDRGSLPVLLGLGPRDARAHAVGQYSARRRGRHAHPPGRRRRSRLARRRRGRSLYFPVARVAPDLPARRRRSALPRAGLDGDGGARRRVRSADDRWRPQQGEGPGRHPVRPPLPPAGQGHAGPALASRPATCMCRWWSRRRRI